MFLHLVNVVHAFMPLSLITGMLLGVWMPVYGKKASRLLIINLALGLVGGIIIYFVSLGQQIVTEGRTSLNAAATLAAAINGGIFILPRNRYRAVAIIGWGAALFFTAVLAATVMFSFLALIAEQALSVISVLNTELVLNIGVILAGTCIIAFVIPLTARMSVKNGRVVIPAFLLFGSVPLIIQWGTEVLLGLMRLEMVELTSGRLSFVAKVSKYSGVLPYIQVFILAALSLLFFTRRAVLTSHDLSRMEKSERRKARSRVLFEMHWFKAALASSSIILVILLYHDLYASRPPKISVPVNLKPDPSGLIRVRISDVADGNLHRYSYVTDDGHVVRFFIISSGRRYKMGVVYDACMLCGDMGYIHEKNEVVCIACNVRIFIPSIGKAGGCNPIPLKHNVEGEYVVISAEDLDKGARYFSEMVSIKVKDPVTGKELINLKAPYRYEYKGRTYFFESKESEKKFRASPETYVGEQQSRYFRVQEYDNITKSRHSGGNRSPGNL